MTIWCGSGSGGKSSSLLPVTERQGNIFRSQQNNLGTLMKKNQFVCNLVQIHVKKSASSEFSGFHWWTVRPWQRFVPTSALLVCTWNFSIIFSQHCNGFPKWCSLGKRAEVVFPPPMVLLEDKWERVEGSSPGKGSVSESFLMSFTFQPHGSERTDSARVQQPHKTVLLVALTQAPFYVLCNITSFICRSQRASEWSRKPLIHTVD